MFFKAKTSLLSHPPFLLGGHAPAACGGIVRNATVGRIVSPAFPSNYSNNLTCHWLLEAPQGQRMHVHFEKVALAEDDDRYGRLFTRVTRPGCSRLCAHSST